MILSRMVLNLNAANARRDLADPYEMHSTLMRLAESAGCKPLWRLHTGRAGEPPVVLIQTQASPDPAAIPIGDAPYYVSLESHHNHLLEAIKQGDRLHFRVHSNPTVTRGGKRHGLVQAEEQLAWLARQLNRAGAVLEAAVASQASRSAMKRRGQGAPIILTGVTFDGLLAVRDPDALRDAVRRGIGHGRAFGFGLITLAR